MQATLLTDIMASEVAIFRGSFKNKPQMHTGGITERSARIGRRRHDGAQSQIYKSFTRDFVGRSLQISTIMLLGSPINQDAWYSDRILP